MLTDVARELGAEPMYLNHKNWTVTPERTHHAL